MDRRPLGRTHLNVSSLGLGLFKLGRNKQFKYPSIYELPTDDQAIDLIRAAADVGINLLDTAPAYGSSEERLGMLLRRGDWPGTRHDWIICTKAGEDWVNETSNYNFTPEHIRFSAYRSIERMGIDHIDVMLIHSNGDDINILNRFGSLDALVELKRTGLIRAIGFSGKTLEGGYAAISRGADVVMVTLNLDEQACLPLIHDASAGHVGVLVKKPLSSGRFGTSNTPSHFYLEWLRRHGGDSISSIVVGTSNPSHLRINASALSHPASASFVA